MTLEILGTNKNTLPKLLLRHTERFQDRRVALREKDRGIWNTYTWSDYYSIVESLAAAFVVMGLKKDEKVAIIGENKPHVYWFELGAQICRAPVVGVFSDCSAEEIKYFLTHSDCRFVVCQDQEQVDKLLEIKDEVPQIRKVIYWEERGLWSYRDPWLLNMEEMMKEGREHVREHPGVIRAMIEETRGDDVAAFFYSSGTTGKPKAAVQTHFNIIAMAHLMDQRYFVSDTDDAVSFLPIAWIGEQLFNVSYSLYKGFTVNFPESQETIQANIREVGPQVLMLSPRLWEEHIRTIRVKMANASWLNRTLFNLALKVGLRAGDAKMKGRTVSPPWYVLSILAEALVFRPLRDRLGLRRIRVARTAGTAVSPDVIRYFHAIGVPLVQLYGSSECGVATMHPKNQVKAETCGVPLDGYNIRISDEGEVLVKSPCLFKEYFKEPKKTAKAIKNGWFHTGDFGHVDDEGHLIVMDRMDDLQRIRGDKLFSPQFAETRLRFSPYIKDALVVGHEDYDYSAAIINIDYDNVAHWAEKNRVVFTTFLDLSQKNEVVRLVRSEIEAINGFLPEWARIERFINLHKEFDADEEELTRTRKVRRDFMEKKYHQLIDALYSEHKRIDVTATVTYRDGTTAELKSSVTINSVTSES
ncbi:MAG: AMP-binding protein [Desulfomonilaceae bacterium]|nr:AMP-binding protein [Desulfomonilaceae bacterium]